MKKLLLLSVITLGAVTASKAGIRVNIGIGLPVPGVVVSQPAPVYVVPAPVYPAPAPVCATPAPVVYAAAAPAAVYYPAPQAYCSPAPAVVVSPPSFWFGFGRFWHGNYHRGWDRDRHHHR